MSGQKEKISTAKSITAIMPCMVTIILCMTPGRWENHAMGGTEISLIIVRAVFFSGIGVGLVEEMLFCGVIMGVLENRCNRYAAF